MLHGKHQVRASLKERMAYDFEKMKRSQIDEIRIGEFSWATIEPAQMIHVISFKAEPTPSDA
jgi:beta-galactosidase GanA